MGSQRNLRGRALEDEIRRLRRWMSDRDIAIALGETAGIFSARIGGLTLEEAGRRYGAVTKQAIADRLRQAGLPTYDQDYRERRDREFIRRLGPEIRHSWARGVTRADIAAKHSLTVATVGAILREVVTDDDRRARSVALGTRRRQGDAGRPARDLLAGREGLRRAARYLHEAQRLNGGRPPTRTEYAKIAREHRELPLVAALTAEATYSEIQAAAGHRARAQPRRPRIAADECWAALRKVAAELGDADMPPTSRDYERVSAGRDDLPSASVVRRRAGGWHSIYRDWPGPR